VVLIILFAVGATLGRVWADLVLVPWL